MGAPHTTFPPAGRSLGDVWSTIEADRAGDLDWRGGRAFSLVYNVDDPEVEELVHRVGSEFLHESALNPFRYRSLLRMEQELVGMACDLFGAAAGSLSLGGTDSIFLAVMTARDHALARGVERPALVACETAHPAFAKACHYLQVEEVRLPAGPDGRLPADAVAEAVDERTALVVASAPSYPFGVIDPVEAVAAVAADRGVLCHVDACLGGWLLPFWERLGEPVPRWDLRTPGVTSLSADLHKYGYAPKGVSCVLYADPELHRRQIFLFDAWPGGIYASPGSAGTRPAAPIAAAWAVVNHLGTEGYTRLAARVRAATRAFRDGIEAIDGLHVTSDPELSIFEFGSDVHDIAAIGDVMEDRGWNLDRQQGGLHVMLSPGHDKVAGAFLDDLRHAVEHHGESRGEAMTYGGVA